MQEALTFAVKRKNTDYFDVPEPDAPPEELLGSGDVVLPVEPLEPVVDEPPAPDELPPAELPPVLPDDELGSVELLPEPVEPELEAPPLVLPDGLLVSLLPPVEPLPAEPLVPPDVPASDGLALELEPEPGVDPEEPGVLPVLPALPAEPPAEEPPSVALGGEVGDVGDAPAVVPVPPAAPVLPVDPAAPLLGVLPAAPAVLLSAGGVVVDGVLALGAGVLGVLAVLLGVDVEPPAPPAAPVLGLPPDSEPSRLHPANANPINAVTRTTLEVLTIAFMELPFTWSRSR